MNALLELKSPKQNVAQKAVVLVQTASQKIKETLTIGIMEGKDSEELTKLLNDTIGSFCKQIDNIQLREETRKALVIATRKWHYQLSQTLTILNQNLKNQVNKFKEDIFTIDFKNMLNAELGKKSINTFRSVLTQTSKGLAVVNDYDKLLKVALKALAAEPPKVIKVKETDKRKGYVYTMSLRNRAEMSIRYESNMNDLQKFIDADVEFVWASSHPDASPRCAPHQGKLYSINPDKKNGTIDSISYTYLPDVLKLNEGNSIINGYNCRHRLVPYQKGSKPPQDYTLEEIKREYAVDQKQRQYENSIRQMKSEERLLREAGYSKEASRLRKRWRRRMKEYEIFSLENNRAFYRWRTIINQNETEYQATYELQNEAKNGIINRGIHGLINSETGAQVETTIVKVDASKLKSFTKERGWYTDWADFANNPKVQVYAMFARGDRRPQGFMAIEHKKDKGGTYLNWICTAPWNNKQIDGKQEYKGVGYLMIAKAAEESIKAGFGGFMYGFANNKDTLQHYVNKWGGEYVGLLHSNHVIFDEKCAKNLIEQYKIINKE